ncbi:hypothetical protein [Aeromonas hydrophila]|uniref:hypothetical protein n=1 Tax=Aeromonas hydrophila TaxID=644 RepID=UPI0023651C35|nr:hypothetical protein [Aeromonas hydrophila]WDF90664.1 hypothetical protein PUB83_21830 [Aeromonas hydrophila subsp. hydrophila]
MFGRQAGLLSGDLLEPQYGSLGGMVYTLPLGINTNSAIKLELVYFEGMILREHIFKSGSCSGGTVILNSSSGDLGKMPALVVGKLGNN